MDEGLTAIVEHGSGSGRRALNGGFQIAAVFFVALAVFSLTAGYGLVWDDIYLVERVKEALSRGKALELFTSSFYVKLVQSTNLYRPTMMASLAADAVVAGAVPWFSHLVNILLHAVNSVLALLVFRRILPGDAGPLTGAILFAVHPAHAEAVSCVAGRMDLLAFLFVLPGALLFLSERPEAASRSAAVRTLTGVSFFLGCLAKETAFMLPVALAGFWALRPRRAVARRLADLAVLAAAAGGALIVRGMVFAREAAFAGTGAVPPGASLPGAGLARSVKILLVNLRLATMPFPDRSLWFGDDPLLDWPTIGAAACFIALAVWALRRSPGPAIAGLVWWAAFTLPVLGFFSLGKTVAAERYAYLPSLGFCLLVGALASSLKTVVITRMRVFAAFGALVLAVSAMIHARDWRDGVAFFSDVTRSNPHFEDGYLNLGAALSKEGRDEEALRVLDRGLAVAPSSADMRFNRGNLLFRTKRFDEAVREFDAALAGKPRDSEAALNRGSALLALGRDPEAAESYKDALSYGDRTGKALVGLAVMAARGGRHEEAVDLLNGALEKDADLAEAHEALGVSLMALGRYPEAEASFLRALDASPGNFRAAVHLGDLFMGSGRPQQAVPAYQAALAANPSLQEAWTSLMIALEAAGRRAEAESRFRSLVLRNPALAARVRDAWTRAPSLTAAPADAGPLDKSPTGQ